MIDTDEMGTETRTKYAVQSLGNYLPPSLLLTLFESYAYVLLPPPTNSPDTLVPTASQL